MIDSKVSVRRFLKAMFAATARSECLGLVLLAARPDELDVGAGDLRGTLGPYIGLGRPVAAGYEGPGVVLPEGYRVLAEGLDGHCWPGSETAFRAELAAPAPTSWDREPRARHGAGVPAVARRAAAEVAWSFGLEARATPAMIVLDPASRCGTVISLPPGARVRAIGGRLVEELDRWPLRRLAVVESLLAARMEHIALERPDDAAVAGLRAEYTAALRTTEDHARAVLLSRCGDALDELGSPAGRGPTRDGYAYGRIERLRATITTLRDEIERCDRAHRVADAAVRAAGHELGRLQTTESAPPETLPGWRFHRLRAPGLLTRMARSRAYDAADPR